MTKLEVVLWLGLAAIVAALLLGIIAIWRRSLFDGEISAEGSKEEGFRFRSEWSIRPVGSRKMPRPKRCTVQSRIGGAPQEPAAEPA